MRTLLVLYVGAVLIARYSLRVIAATGTAFLIVSWIVCIAFWSCGRDPHAEWLTWPAMCVLGSWLADAMLDSLYRLVVDAYQKRVVVSPAHLSITLARCPWR